jgi:hypothetical protein
MLYAVRVSRFGVVPDSYRLRSERYYDRSNQEYMQNLWEKTEAESPCYTSVVGMGGKDGRLLHVSTRPNNALQLTAYSVRSSLAPASGSS